MLNSAINNVNELLEKFVGGEIFFDELDESVRTNKEILRAIYDMASKDPANKGCKYIVSGKTGERFLHTLDLVVLIYVPGGLRKKGTSLDLKWHVKPGDRVIFMDDSYFMGRTEAVIRNAVEAQGGEFVGTYVFYDGCHEKRDNVHSIYRYYDYHDILGNKLD